MARDGQRSQGITLYEIEVIVLKYDCSEIRSALSDLVATGPLEKCGQDKYRLISLEAGKRYERSSRPLHYWIEK